MGRANVERFDRDMMRGRTVPDDLERPDRQFRYIRIQMEQVEELRDSGRNPSGLAHSLGLVAESLSELGWHDLARLVHLENLDILRELPGRHEQKLGWVLTALRETLMKLERYEEALPVNYEVWQLHSQHEDAQSRDSANGAKNRKISGGGWPSPATLPATWSARNARAGALARKLAATDTATR